MDATLREEVLVKIMHDRCLFFDVFAGYKVPPLGLGPEGNEC